jgi:hypothetical protein
MGHVTSETAQSKLIDPIESRWILNIVLDHIDIIGGGEETREGGGARVPHGCRDDAWEENKRDRSAILPRDPTQLIFIIFHALFPNILPENQVGMYMPFWMRIFKLSFTNSEVSKTIKRKLRGRTS